MSLRGESRSERKVSRPVWPICPLCFLLKRKVSLSGIHKVTEMFSWLFEFSLLQFRACFTPLGLLWAHWSEFRWAIGNNPVCVVLSKVFWLLSTLCMNLDLPGNELFTPRARPAVSSNPQESQCQAVFVFLGALFILQTLSTKVITWIALVSSLGHQPSGKLLAFSSLGARGSAASYRGNFVGFKFWVSNCLREVPCQEHFHLKGEKNHSSICYSGLRRKKKKAYFTRGKVGVFLRN